MRKLLLPVMALLATTAAPAWAQAGQCRLPDIIPRPRVEGPTADEPRRILPVGSYTLAISWSPAYCARSRGAAKDDFQCGPGQNFGFTLHGLWPDGQGKDWPQYCKAAPVLPRKVVRDHLCATPSVQLIQHEWVKHGTCLPTTPTRFFALSRRLYHAVRYPDMAALAARPTLSARDFATAFAAANGGMTADMMRLNVARDGRLSEVWICLDKRLRYTRCPAHQGGVNDATRIRIEPQD